MVCMQEEELSLQISTMWTNFARDGSPAGADWPEWGTQRLNVVFETASAAQGTMAVEAGYRNQTCGFWADIYSSIF